MLKALIVMLLFGLVSVTVSQPVNIEGFGSVTSGGAGKPVYHVTSLLDDGSYGTLRDALAQGNRYIVFDTAGTITVSSNLEIIGSNITIDGSTAPYPGITLAKSKLAVVIISIHNARDIILTHLRIRGWMDENADWTIENRGAIAIHNAGAGSVRNIVLSNITVRNAIDSGMDIWGDVQNVSIQYCLLAMNHSPQTISHYGSDEFKARRNISIHHNVYARNNERNPQLRADTRNVDYVNNIVYDWAFWNEPVGYGLRVKNQWEPGEPKVTINIIKNAFIATRRHAWALVYGKDAGSDQNDKGPVELLEQGTIYLDSDMDSVYVTGNILPEENIDHWSTIPGPLPVPDYAKVTTYPAAELADLVVPFAGTHYPLQDEREIFNAITDSLRAINLRSGQ